MYGLEKGIDGLENVELEVIKVKSLCCDCRWTLKIDHKTAGLFSCRLCTKKSEILPDYLIVKCRFFKKKILK